MAGKIQTLFYWLPPSCPLNRRCARLSVKRVRIAYQASSSVQSENIIGRYFAARRPVNVEISIISRPAVALYDPARRIVGPPDHFAEFLNGNIFFD